MMQFFRARSLFHGLCLGGLGLLASSCALDENGNPIPLFQPAAVAPPAPVSDPKSPYFSASHHVVVNEALLATTNQQNSAIEISLAQQRARLFRLEPGGKRSLVIETQISTGKEGHYTPTGQYRILEKSVQKKSSLYGKWVNASTGETIVGNGDSRKPPGVEGAEFRGTPMPYWLRITGDGVGMHVGFVPNYPASHGCIRVPKALQPLIYERTRVGTPVTIVR